MNDQLQAQITTILKQFSDGISTVGDVAMEELPDIAQQYVVYGFWKGLLNSIISVAFVIACIVAIIEGIKLIRRTGNDEYGFIFVGATPGIIFGSIVAYFTIQNLLLNVFAPKLWLLLEIKNLIS